MTSKEKVPPCAQDGQAAPRLASDTCEPWCIVDQHEHTDYRDDHVSRPTRVDLWTTGGLHAALYVQLNRPYVDGVLLDDAGDRHTDVTVHLAGGTPMLRLPAPVARSLAAALVRAAELAEDPFRG